MRAHILSIGLAVSACGSPNASTPDAPAAPDAPPLDANLVHLHGLVALAYLHAASMGSSGVTAQFSAGGVYGDPIGTDGACSMFHNPPKSGLSAGTITISGTTMPITLTPSGTPVQYNASSVPEHAFSAGAMLTASAAGAEFPAFTATTTAPTSVAGFTAPSSISRAAGYQATWTQDGGRIWLALEAENSASDAYLLLCKVPDTGSYTVTPAALALFPAATGFVGVSLARVAEADVNVGADDIAFVALDVQIAGAGDTMLTP